jgi:hypothetical protein
MSRHTTPRRTARLLPVVAVALAVVLSGCGSEDEPAATADPTASDSPSASGSAEPVVLIADGSNAGKCAMPSADVLSRFDTAFEGTVTSVDGGAATLEVEQGYACGAAATVTVQARSTARAALLLAVDFQEGQTYLVSADGDRVTLCGFTAETTPELEALYTEAFPAEG